MTIRSRPILDRRHRPRWQDELRTQQLTVIGFAVAIALAIGIFGAAAWNGYWEAHLRPVAAVEDATFDQSDLLVRARIIGAEIAAEATELSLQMGGPRDQLIEQQIQQLSQAAQEVETTAARSLVDGAVLGARAEEFGIEVTDDEVTAGVAERTLRPERVRAQLILVEALPDDAEPDAEPTEEQMAAAREAAAGALERLEAGENFAEVAGEVSDDFTAQTGGVLGWFRADDPIYAEYFTALEEAEAGDLVGPVETETGYAVLELLDRREETREGGITTLLEQQGITDAQYRDFVAETLLLDEFREVFETEVVASPAPQRRVAQIVIQPVSGDPVPQERARHVLIQPDPDLDDQAEASDEQWAAAQAEATEVRERLVAEDADWFEIAEEVSDDPGSGARGGDLGWYDPESSPYVEEFAEALAELEVGEVSEPVRTEFGWHVIQKTGVRESPAEQAADLVEELRADPDSFGEVATRVSEDATTARDGGELGWVARYQLPRMQEDAVFALEEGEISDPIEGDMGAITIYRLLEVSESREVEEERLERIRSGGFERWLDEEVRAGIDTWVDPDYAASTTA